MEEWKMILEIVERLEKNMELRFASNAEQMKELKKEVREDLETLREMLTGNGNPAAGALSRLGVLEEWRRKSKEAPKAVLTWLQLITASGSAAAVLMSLWVLLTR